MCLRVPMSLVLMLSCALAAAQDDGEEDLNRAFKLKLNASSTRDLDEVADLCESAIEKGLEESSLKSAQQLWASVLLEHGRMLSERILKIPPDPRWQFHRQQALERLSKSVELSPDHAESHMIIARLNALPGGDQDAAKTALERVIELSADNPSQKAQAFVLRAGLAEDTDTRIADLRKALEVDPDGSHEESAGVYLLLAKSLADSGKTEEAIESLTKAIEITEDSPLLFSERARLFLALNRDEEAMEDVSKSLDLNPRNPDALLMRSNLYFEKGRDDKSFYEKALEDVDKVLVFQPGSAQAIYMRSFVHAAMENYESAIEDINILVRFDPKNSALRVDLAMFHNAAERPRRATQIYGEVLKDEPDNQRALRGRGDAGLSTGDHEQAITDYNRALELDSEDSGVLNNLAWVLATSPKDELRDGERSVELGLKACELTEYNAAHILSTLAAGYAEVGDFEKAKDWAAKAVEKGEGDEQIENLTKELESYKRGEPWREMQIVEERAPNQGGGDLDVSGAGKKDGDSKDDNQKKGEGKKKGGGKQGDDKGGF